MLVPLHACNNLFQALSSHCTNLKTLNLSRCQKLPSDSVVTIVNGCRHLQDVDLTATTVSDNVLFFHLRNNATQ